MKTSSRRLLLLIGCAALALTQSGGAELNRLVNLSTRTQAGTGTGALIVGFVVGPGQSKQVLIRAVGPGLGAFGVAGTLADPKLDLFQGTTLIQSNDNWA